MDKKISSKTLGLIVSVILLVATIGGYVWLWISAQPGEISNSVADQTYQVVSIDNVETDAKALVKDKANQGKLPITAPTSDKIGRENPFAGI